MCNIRSKIYHHNVGRHSPSKNQPSWEDLDYVGYIP